MSSEIVDEKDAVEVEEIEAVVPPSETKVEFAVWFVMREKQIPGQHLGEILWADFKARGCGKVETVAKYDAALAAYGIKL